MPLPWAPKSLVDDTDNWSFTNSANRAMTDLATMGERLMQPVTQQVRQVVEQAMPAPAPQPSPAPQPVVPSVPRFSLGKIEDWLTPAGAPQPAPQLEQPAPPQMPWGGGPMVGRLAEPAPAADTKPTGMFSLPSLESFLGTPSPTAAPGSSPAAPTPGRASPAAPETLGPIAEGDPKAFFATAGPYAREAERRTGIPAALSLAIAANETGYGQRRYMAGSNNFHGIQARAGEAGAVPYKDWRPGPGGEQQVYNAAQRSFADPLAGFLGFASFLTDNPRYAPALERYRQTQDVNRLAADIHAAGYAEDPQYTTKITSIMRGIPVSTGVGEVTAPAGVAPPTATGRQQTPPTASLDVRGLTEAYKGVPYTFGGPGGRGQGVGATTDCSGFVSAVWKSQYGLDLPAHTDAAYNQLKKLGGAEVEASQARPGDVVFYMGAGTGGAITHHMGVYAGPGTVLDMSVSGGSGVKERPIGHGGRYVIIRDPRLNASVPSSAAPPPPIVPTGLAEATGGRQVPQRTVNAASEQPRPLNPVARGVAPPAPVEMPTSSYNDPTAGGTISQPLAAPAVHDNVLSAFRSANGRDPDPSELAELASLGYGLA